MGEPATGWPPPDATRITASPRWLVPSERNRNNPSMPATTVNSLNNKITGVKQIITAGIENPDVPAQTGYDKLLAAYQDLYSYSQAVKPTPPPSTPATETPAEPTPTPTDTAAG